MEPGGGNRWEGGRGGRGAGGGGGGGRSIGEKFMYVRDAEGQWISVIIDMHHPEGCFGVCAGDGWKMMGWRGYRYNGFGVMGCVYVWVIATFVVMDPTIRGEVIAFLRNIMARAQLNPISHLRNRLNMNYFSLHDLIMVFMIFTREIKRKDSLTYIISWKIDEDVHLMLYIHFC